MPGRGVVEEVALGGRDNGEMEGGILLANCVDEDYIAVDTRGGGIIVELFVDSVAG